MYSVNVQYRSKSYHFRTVPSRKSETEAVITLSYYAVCMHTVPYCTIPYCTVPCTILLYYTIAGRVCFLINAHQKLCICQRGAVRYGIHSIRNGTRVLSTLHGTEQNSNSFLIATVHACICMKIHYRHTLMLNQRLDA